MTLSKSQEPLGYQIRFEPRAGYLYAHTTGEKDSLEISRSIWTRIAGECKRLGYNKVLVVEDLKQRLPLLDLYQICTELPSLGFSQIKVAYVDLLASEQQDLQFGETVARNRGTNGRVFSTIEEAERWLLSTFQI